MIAIILTVVLLIGLIPFPWGLFGRDCLLHDGSISQYSMFNQETKSFSPSEITAVRIKTTRKGKKASINYGVSITLTTNTGKTYSFEISDFRQDSYSSAPQWLSSMVVLKRRYDSHIITYETKYSLEAVIADNHLSDAEATLLHQLFDMP